MLTSLFLVLTSPANAWTDNGEVFNQECIIACEQGGWEIKVSRGESSGNEVLTFSPRDTIYTFGDDQYQAGDTWIADATAQDGYCVNMPAQLPTTIIGDVWERTGSSPYPSIASTPPLNAGSSHCDLDLSFVLYTMEVYSDASYTLPTYCEDAACLTGGGVDHTDPGNGAGTYTDASGEIKDLGELAGQDDPANYEEAEVGRETTESDPVEEPVLNR